MKEGWESLQFEDCIESIVYPTKIQRKDFLSEGAYPIVSQEESLINGFWDEAGDVFEVDRPVVVFGDHTRILKYIDFEFVLGADGVKVLKPRHFLDPRFFFYQLHTAKLSSLGYARHYRLLKEHRVSFPAFAEQRRIASILDEAFEGIATAKAHAEKNLRNAREVFNSALDGALSRIGHGYVETTLGDEAEVLAGYAFPSKGYVAATNGVRLLRGDNIMQGFLRWEDAKAWPTTDCAPYERFALRAGDVVLAMDRPWVKAGLKRAQLGVEDLPSLLLQRTARLRPRERMTEDFLFRLTGSDSFSRHLLALQTGIGVPHISGKQIESYRFALPPIEAQRKIALALDEMDRQSQRLAENYQCKLAALGELKQSLLHQAFSGQL